MVPLETVPDEIYTVLIELIKALFAFRFFASTFATLFTVEILRIHSTVRELAFTKSAYTSTEDKFPVTTDDTDVYPALKTAVEKMFPGQHVTVFPFARTCLHAVLTGMHLPPKSKILMTPITIGPMVEVIESLGHEVVFVDIEKI